MKTLILVLLLSLTACTTVPVERSFPEVPKTFMEKSKELKFVSDKASFSEMLDVMIDNYSEYYLVMQKLNAWQQWYLQQKEIFNGVKE